jgi:hypothetical protein
VNTTDWGNREIARWTDVYGSGFLVTVRGLPEDDGVLCVKWVNAFSPSGTVTIAGANTLGDGETHDVAVTLTNNAGTMELSAYQDGVQVGTTQTWASPFGSTGIYNFDQLYLGGHPKAVHYIGAMAHAAGYSRALTSAEILEHRTASTTGFAGERSDQRIARVAVWAGWDPAALDLDTGAATIDHVECTGKNAWEYLEDTAFTEGGLVFVSADGFVTFHARTRYTDTSSPVDLTIPADEISPDVRVVSNMEGLANDVTVTRREGASARARNPDSITRYGLASDSITLISDSDSQSFDRASWLVAVHGEPSIRFPDLPLDGLTGSVAADVRGLLIGSRVQVTGMPSQAPASTLDLRVEGYSERISTNGWDIRASTTPYFLILPLVLGDATYGQLDSTNRLAY